MFEKQRNLMGGKAKLEPSINEEYPDSHAILRSAKLDEANADTAAGKPADAHAANTNHGAMIGPSIHIRGDITGDEDLLIEGTIDGAVNFSDKLVTVGQSGRVDADITARIIRVEGQMKGDMIGTDKVIIAATGQAHGNIVAPRITMEDGAQFRGNVNMESPVEHSAESISSARAESTPSHNKRGHVVDARSMSARAVVVGQNDNRDEQLEQALMKARSSSKAQK